jgi:hypothetical protein
LYAEQCTARGVGQDQGMTEPKAESHTVTIVGPDGQPMGEMEVPAADGTEERSPAELVEQPAKVMRIGSMVKQLLEEVRAAPLDDGARTRLREIYESSIKELGEGLAPELREELDRVTLPFNDDTVPTDAELRIAQAQLVGWLEGLFHGIQTALFAQQMAARVQLEQMRGGQPALPPGQLPGGAPQAAGPNGGTGQYL